eukprot:3641078-Amphidinium_carterae.1
MFTPVPDDLLIFVEAPPEAGLGADKVWRLRKAMNGLQVSSRLFQDHLARRLKVVVTVHVDDPIVAGTSEGIRMFLRLVGTELKVRENEAWSREAQ